MTPIAEIVLAAIHVASGLLHRLWKIWDDKDHITVDQARERVSAAFEWAQSGYKRDEQDLRNRIEDEISKGGQ